MEDVLDGGKVFDRELTHLLQPCLFCRFIFRRLLSLPIERLRSELEDCMTVSKQPDRDLRSDDLELE